jgi:uncharacterized membrane protein YoaK (UPF0700 family)
MRWWAALVRHPVHGPLPALLLVLSAVAGIIDAVSLLTLGRVFVANMTGNILVLGLALAGVPGIVKETSLVALAAFMIGAFVGGRMIIRFGGHRGKLMIRMVGLQLVFMAVAIPVAIPLTEPQASLVAIAVAALLAIAMGIQNAAVRSLKVPDITTTVVTMAVTGLIADAHGGGGEPLARRALAVLALFAGAAVGALLVLHVGAPWALAAAALLVGVVVVTAVRTSRTPAPWHAPR